MWQDIVVYIIIGIATLHVLAALATALGFEVDPGEDEDEDDQVATATGSEAGLN